MRVTTLTSNLVAQQRHLSLSEEPAYISVYRSHVDVHDVLISSHYRQADVKAVEVIIRKCVAMMSTLNPRRAPVDGVCSAWQNSLYGNTEEMLPEVWNHISQVKYDCRRLKVAIF